MKKAESARGEKTPETPGTGEEDKQPTEQPDQKDYDEEGRLVREYDADGYLAKEYTYNAGRMMEYQYDEQGNLKRAGAMAGNKEFKFSCDTQERTPSGSIRILPGDSFLQKNR